MNEYSWRNNGTSYGQRTMQVSGVSETIAYWNCRAIFCRQTCKGEHIYEENCWNFGGVFKEVNRKVSQWWLSSPTLFIYRWCKKDTFLIKNWFFSLPLCLWIVENLIKINSIFSPRNWDEIDLKDTVTSVHNWISPLKRALTPDIKYGKKRTPVETVWTKPF